MANASPHSVPSKALAVIGMAGQFPGAKTVDEFWRNLARGLKSIRVLSDEELLAAGVSRELVNDPNYVKKAAVLDEIDLFDAAFFGFTPREAETLDPQARLFLQCAWTALEDAGYTPQAYDVIGVFAGKSVPDYRWGNLAFNPDFVQMVSDLQMGIYNDSDSLSPIVAYKMDLKGPSVSVQSFCSTSMLAVHLACQSLLAYECDLALTGGVAIAIPHGVGYLYQEGGILSPDGECRALDANANGSIMGSGVGVVVLKRLNEALEDGDHIYAVIRGSATNNDGTLRVGYTAPGVNGQAAVISEALSVAGVDIETIGYVETHGTGTPLGDSIELEAMLQAFSMRTKKTGYCAIGSIKPNVGHLDRAAGIANLIATTLALHHKLLPPSLNFEKANPEVNLERSPFYVNTQLQPWESNGPWPRRAGVSSFGLGGTNVHVVLEEAPPLPPSSDSRPYQLLLLSAKTDSALEIATSNLVDYLRKTTANLADVAFTLQTGRVTHNHHRMVVCRDAEDGATALAMNDPRRVFTVNQSYRNRPVAFMFPGVGDHYVDMGRALYQTEPIFRQWIDQCAELLMPELGLDVRHVLYPHQDESQCATAPSETGLDLRRMLGRAPTEASPLQQTALAQPIVFAVEYALAQLLMAWGIRPQAVVGYSLGEYSAACIAGVLSLKDAMRLVARRAQLIQALPPGAMLAVTLSEAQVQPFLSPDLSIAGILTPTTCVVSGSSEDIEALRQRLDAQDIICHPVVTTHAFHSSMMQPIVDDLAAVIKTVTLHPPQIPCLSNLTGAWLTDTQATDPTYWTRHLCQTVQFAASVETLAQDSRVLLEVGPGKALGSFVKQHPALSRDCAALVLATLPHAYDNQPADACLLETIGKLWLAGVTVDWAGFYANETRQRLSLPTYPFERQRFWIQPERSPSAKHPDKPEAGSLPEAEEERQPFRDWFYLRVWRQTGPVFSTPLETRSNWLLFTDESGLGDQVAARLEECHQTVVTAQAGAAFKRVSDTQYVVRPHRRDDYEELVSRLKQRDLTPSHIVHLWNVTADSSQEGDTLSLERTLDTGFYSLMYLAQALGEMEITSYRLFVVASQMHLVTGTEKLRPGNATLIGPGRVIPKEYPQASCRLIDVCLPVQHAWQAEALFDNLFCEITSNDFMNDIIALRGHQRWVQALERHPMPSMDGSISALLRPNGVYLITGGLGGLGLAMAEHLAQTVQAKLVLLGRTPLPPREQWKQILAEQGDAKGLGYKISRVQRLEALGAEVLVVAADVSNLTQVQAAIHQAVSRFGAIHGVLHMAGVPGIGLIQLKTPEMAAQVLAPKVMGTVVLERALQDISLDFMVLFSSAAAETGGGPGQVDYAAANAFLNAYAASRLGEKRRTVSIGWDDWQWNAWDEGLEGFGAQVSQAIRARRTKYGLSFAEGSQALMRVLASRLPHVVVSSLDFNRVLISSQDFTVDHVLELGPGQHESRPRYPRPTLGTSYVAPRNDLERKIVNLWSEMLGIADIGVLDNFFDLGGNSLVGLSVIARLKKELGLAKLPAHVIYEAPSASDLAKFLDQNRDAKKVAFAEGLERGDKRRQAIEQENWKRER